LLILPDASNRIKTFAGTSASPPVPGGNVFELIGLIIKKLIIKTFNKIL